MAKLSGRQYLRVYGDIVTKIYCEQWKKGDTLPRLEDICEQYSVGRNTARTALQLLEERGYIVHKGKKPPKVCFDWEDKERRDIYLQELAGRKEAIQDVFQLMITMMPELFSQIIKELTESQRKEMIEFLETYIEEMQVTTEQELSNKLVEIYVKALSFLNNETMLHLFYSLYYFVQIPLENPQQNMRFRATVVLIKFVLKRFRNQVKNQDIDKLRDQIQLLCQTMKKNTANYLNRICKGVTPNETQQYDWITKGDTAYLLLAIELVRQIQAGTLKTGDILPSYAKLAEESEVSQKTSRNALKLLNEWNIVTTVNGVGSRVNELSQEERCLILKEPLVQENMKIFFEVLQIFVMTCRPVIREYVEDGVRSPVVRSVYKKMSYILRWGKLLEFCGMEYVEDKEFLYDRTDKRLPEIFYQDIINYEKKARTFWDSML